MKLLLCVYRQAAIQTGGCGRGACKWMRVHTVVWGLLCQDGENRLAAVWKKLETLEALVFQ